MASTFSGRSYDVSNHPRDDPVCARSTVISDRYSILRFTGIT